MAIGVVPLPQNGLRHVLSHVLWVAMKQELLVDEGEVIKHYRPINASANGQDRTHRAILGSQNL